MPYYLKKLKITVSGGVIITPLSSFSHAETGEAPQWPE